MITGNRAGRAWRSAVQLIRTAEWPAGRTEQLDVLWLLALTHAALQPLVPFYLWRAEFRAEPELSMAERVAYLAGRDPLALVRLGPLLDAGGRHYAGTLLADTLADLGCLVGAGPVWWSSADAAEAWLRQSALVRPFLAAAPPESIVSRETCTP